LWGWPHDADTLAELKRVGADSNWHLAQMKVPEAWAFWTEERKQRLPAEAETPLPGADVLIGHPDTGYSDSPEVRGRYRLPGHSFLRDRDGKELDDARDDLQRVGPTGPLQFPGHGTTTASLLASGEHDASAPPEAYGVAPGARVLPLRVSRSVIH